MCSKRSVHNFTSEAMISDNDYMARVNKNISITSEAVNTSSDYTRHKYVIIVITDNGHKLV
jgi:hypothetical protein